MNLELEILNYIPVARAHLLSVSTFCAAVNIMPVVFQKFAKALSAVLIHLVCTYLGLERKFTSCRQRLVFWNSIHLEVASDSFCFLLYSSWLLVFILYVFSLFFSFINLYCWKGLLFS